jgi:hypothetical protein
MRQEELPSHLPKPSHIAQRRAEFMQHVMPAHD